jgi:hypothetical protein
MDFSRLLCTGFLAIGLVGATVPAGAQSGGRSMAPAATEAGTPDRGREAADRTPEAATGQCATQRITIRTNPEGDQVSTASTVFVNVPRSGLTFTQGGTAPSCVMVRFSAVTFAPDKRVLDVRVLVDGRVAQPGPVLFSGDDDEDFDGRWARAHSFDFLVPNVAPGQHNVRVQARSFTGGPVYLNTRSTVVHHR